MIEITDLTFSGRQAAVKDIQLIVPDNAIHFLISNNLADLDLLLKIMEGFCRQTRGSILADQKKISCPARECLAGINRIDNKNDFDPEITLMDFVNFTCSLGKTSRSRVFELLLFFDMFSRDLKKKIKHCDNKEFQAVYLALCLAGDANNLVFNDFIRGVSKDFELRFNKLLLELKKAGKAILYLTGDIFYAFQLADSVSFLKNGFQMPAEPIQAKDLKEMDVMTLYKKYLS
jgi:ABC-2 type transport system ATP-binding protein